MFFSMLGGRTVNIYFYMRYALPLSLKTLGVLQNNCAVDLIGVDDAAMKCNWAHPKMKLSNP